MSNKTIERIWAGSTVWHDGSIKQTFSKSIKDLLKKTKKPLAKTND